MSGDTPFENTARVLRVRDLHRAARAVLSQITDATRVMGGRVIYPGEAGNEMTIKDLGVRAGYGVSSTQRALKKLQAWKLLRIVVRPGKAYVFIPLVNQLPLSLLEATEQPSLPDLQASAGAVELEAHPASTWSKHGHQGKFAPVGDFHRIGTEYRSSVEKSDAPTLDFNDLEAGTKEGDRYSVPIRSVQSTDPIGTLYRSSPRTKEVQTQTQTQEESAAAPAAGLSLMGIPLTPEQRQALSRAPAEDNNLAVLKALALCIGRDPLEARKYALVAIESEGDLREATKTAAAQIPGIRYDLTTKDGEGVLHLAVKLAWSILRREGVVHDKPLEVPSARRRRGGRGT